MSDVVERLKKVFEWVEQWDLRVGDLWLHPKQVGELNALGHPGWDKVCSARVRQAFLEDKGALYVGMIFGARVFESEKVPEDHVAVVPADLDAKLVGSAACRPI